MANLLKDIKTFNIRMPRSIWLFLRDKAAEKDSSMNQVILGLVDGYKRRLENKAEKKLTTE